MSSARRRIRLRYTLHAKLRCVERGLSLDDIERAVTYPVETIYDLPHKNYKSFIKVDSQYLVVIHTNPNKPEIAIITAYYKDRGGLKKLGFSNV
jgi:hypothetical protein